MKIRPVGTGVPPIVFKSENCQPLRPLGTQPLKTDEFVKNADELNRSYEEQQKQKEIQAELERIQKEQEFHELVNRPGKFERKENDNNRNNRNPGFQ